MLNLFKVKSKDNRTIYPDGASIYLSLTLNTLNPFVLLFFLLSLNIYLLVVTPSSVVFKQIYCQNTIFADIVGNIRILRGIETAKRTFNKRTFTFQNS